MPTESMFDSAHDRYEFQARLQLGVGDDYKLIKVAGAIPVNLEDRIDELDASGGELEDDQKWEELMETHQNPVLAWLPKGWLVVTMRHRDSPKGQIDATGFIQIDRPDGEASIHHETGGGKTQAAGDIAGS